MAHFAILTRGKGDEVTCRGMHQTKGGANDEARLKGEEKSQWTHSAGDVRPSSFASASDSRPTPPNTYMKRPAAHAQWPNRDCGLLPPVGAAMQFQTRP